MNEAELIRRSRQGYRDAFGQLIRRYDTRIFRLARQVCAGAPQEADGIYQDSFANAFQKIHRFEGRSQLGTWLYRIASNLCLMRLRKQKRHPMVAIVDRRPSAPESGTVRAEAMVDPEADTQRDAKRKELRRAVVQALEPLPVEDRLVVILRDLHALSGAEVAKVLELSVPDMKSRLHRARSFLRGQLKPVAGS